MQDKKVPVTFLYIKAITHIRSFCMKKLRFFGLLVTVVLLAFGLSVGCNNDTTTTGGDSDPVVYRGTSNGRAVEITFDTAPIPTRARATEPRPGDNYLITIGGQTASSGWIELQEGGLILFHDNTGKGDFFGQLTGQTVIVDVPGESATLTVTRVGGGGTYNPGGGGLGGNVGGGAPGTTAPGTPVLPEGEFTLNAPADWTAVPASSLVLTSNDYIILDGDGNGSLQLEAKIPATASAKVITDWTGLAGSLASGTVSIDGGTPSAAPNGSNFAAPAPTGKKGLLEVKGANPPAAGQTITLNVTIPGGGTDETTAWTPGGPDFTITVYPAGTIAPPKISLVNGADAGTYIDGVSTVRMTTDTRGTKIYYTVDTNGTAATANPGTPSAASTEYTGDIFIKFEGSASAGHFVAFRAIAVDEYGNTSPAAGYTTATEFGQAQAPAPVISLTGADLAAGGVQPGYILGGNAKASQFSISSTLAGAKIYYTTTVSGSAYTANTNPADPTSLSTLYTGPVSITNAMLATDGFSVAAIATALGYRDSAIAIPAAPVTPPIAQAQVQPLVVEVVGGVIPNENQAALAASANYHLGATNPSQLRITSPTKGIDIIYAVDIADPVSSLAAMKILGTPAGSRVNTWSALVPITGLNFAVATTTSALFTAAPSLFVRAYASKPGYMDTLGGTVTTPVDTLTAAVTLTKATVVTPGWMKNPATGINVAGGGDTIQVTKAEEWGTLYNAVEVYCATPGSTIVYTRTVNGTATADLEASTGSGYIATIDISGSAASLTANNQAIVITIQMATKGGMVDSAAPTAFGTLTFNRNYQP